MELRRSWSRVVLFEESRNAGPLAVDEFLDATQPPILSRRPCHDVFSLKEVDLCGDESELRQFPGRNRGGPVKVCDRTYPNRYGVLFLQPCGRLVAVLDGNLNSFDGIGFGVPAGIPTRMRSV